MNVRTSIHAAVWGHDWTARAIGPALDGSYGQVAQSDSPGAALLLDMGKKNTPAYDSTSPYTMESYDAAALIMLAMQAAKSTAARLLGRS